MEFKGTKGKWKIKNFLYTGDTEIITDTHRICDVKHFDAQIDKVLKEPTWEEGKANAILISKAPEMLEMLKDTYLHINAVGKKIRNETYRNGILARVESIKNLIQEATELKQQS